MSCNHDVQHLVGTSEGITCRLCGKQFKTFDELLKDRPTKSKNDEPKAEAEEVIEEKPKRGRKAAK